MTSRSADSRCSSGPAKWPSVEEALRVDGDLAVAALPRPWLRADRPPRAINVQLGATTAIFMRLTFPMAPRRAMGQLRFASHQGEFDDQAFHVRRRCRAASRFFGHRPGAAPTYDLLIDNGTIYDGIGRRAVHRRRRDQGRQDRLCRPAGARHREEDRRRHRQGGLARLHQHAQLGGRKPDRGRPRAERHRPGRHARSVRRGQVDGPAQRRR